MAAPKLKVVVSRKWDKPEIEAYLHSDAVGARIELSAFINALAAEVGKPLFILTPEQLRTKMLDASARVLAEMKDATKFVV